MKVVYEHLKNCKYGPHAARFDVAMRHGAEYPACSSHIAQALTDAYAHDGDHGNVTVYEIGVAVETMTEEPIKKIEGGIMPIVNGQKFRCPCGCNVFHQGEPYEGLEVLVCNACGVEYQSNRTMGPRQ